MKYIPYAIIVVLTILLLLSIKSCNGNKQSFEDISTYQQSLKDSVKYYKDKSGTIIAYKEQIQATETTLSEIRKENASLNKQLEDMKVRNPTVITQIVTHIVHDSLPPIILHDSITSRKNIAFKDSSKYYFIKGLVNNKQIVLTSIDFPDSTLLVTEQKGGFFKKTSYQIDIRHSNPYVRTTSIESISVTPNVPFYKKPLFLILTGFVGGLYLESHLK
jgi:hypothetical protein